jgi:predicted ATP-binding protein involved in virulence
MRLSSLRVGNFRCFENCSLNFHPQLNVFVGGNGSGKTAFLFACRNAVGSILNGFPVKWTEQAALSEYDLRYNFDVSTNKFNRQSELSISFTINEPQLFGKRILRKRELGQKGKGSFKVTGDVVNWTKALSKNIANGDSIDLPVLLFLGTERFKIERKEYERTTLDDRFEGYFNAMNGKSATHKFEKWFFNRDIGDFQNKQQQLGRNFTDIELLRNAVSEFYPHADRIYYNFDVEQLVLVLKSGEHKPLRDLSDGERFMLLTCITIAYYCIQLNLHLGENCLKESKGVVIIDEIDLHLHPKWQREIVPLLLKTFPQIQFIITTHSPQVVGSVKKENLFYLKNNEIISNNSFVEGRDSNSLLNEIFGEKERTKEFDERLTLFYKKISEGYLDEAEHILSDLTKKMGSNDTTIIRAYGFLSDKREGLNYEIH